jgi:hypothetical protein
LSERTLVEVGMDGLVVSAGIVESRVCKRSRVSAAQLFGVALACRAV